MKEWNGGSGPRPRGERTCREAGGIVNEVVDNRADNVLRKSHGRGRTRFRDGNHIASFLRNPGGKRRVCGGGDCLVGGGVRTRIRAVTGDFLNPGQAFVPDALSEQFNPYNDKHQVAVVKQSSRWQIEEVPDCEDEEDSVGIAVIEVGRLYRRGKSPPTLILALCAIGKGGGANRLPGPPKTIRSVLVSRATSYETRNLNEGAAAGLTGPRAVKYACTGEIASERKRSLTATELQWGKQVSMGHHALQYHAQRSPPQAPYSLSRKTWPKTTVITTGPVTDVPLH